jgi:hypothetical protein
MFVGRACASLALLFAASASEQAGCGGQLAPIASTADAAAPANGPGQVRCASESCSLEAGQICCMLQGPAPTCTTACPVGSDSIACDGPEDCPGQVCCEGPDQTGSHATCATECTPGRTVRVCHDATHCPAGASCCPVNAQVYPSFRACTDDC